MKFEVTKNGAWDPKNPIHDQAIGVFGRFVNVIDQLVHDNQSYDYVTNHTTVRDMIVRDGYTNLELTKNMLVVGILTLMIPPTITPNDVKELIGIYDKYVPCCRYQRFLMLDKIPADKIQLVKTGIRNVLDMIKTKFLEHTKQLKNSGLKLFDFYGYWAKHELVVDLENDDLTYKLDLTTNKYRIVTLRFFQKINNELIEIFAIDVLPYTTAEFVNLIDKFDQDIINVVPPQKVCKTV